VRVDRVFYRNLGEVETDVEKRGSIVVAEGVREDVRERK